MTARDRWAVVQPWLMGWPVPPRGGLSIEDYNAVNRARTKYKRELLLRNSLPVVLMEARDD